MVDLHFLDLSSIDQVSHSLSDDFGRVDQVFEDLLVNGGESSVSWSLLGGPRSTTWLLEDSSLSNEDDVSVGELLLKLSGQTLLNLVERLEERDWDKDDDSLLATTDLDFTGSGDLERTQVGLKVGDRCLEVVQGLSDGEFYLIGRVL